MQKLLSAGWVRLIRCKALWFAAAATALYEVYQVLSSRTKVGDGWSISYSMDGCFFQFAGMVCLAAALVCAFFIGPEYGDGTMRNKLLAGHSRRNVYLSNLVLCSLASLIVCLSAVLPGLALGIPLLGPFDMGPGRVVLLVLGILAMGLAYSAIFTLTAMLIPNRAVSLTAALLLAIVFLVLGSAISSRLNALPFEDTGTSVFTDGKLVEMPLRPNPDYLPDGPVRSVFAFLNDFLPGGQAGQYITNKAADPLRLIGMDGVLIAVATIAGLGLFQCKDIH